MNQILTLETAESSDEIKACCSALYESDWARLLLGDSFHPGGLALTERLGKLTGLGPGQRVLDVASGSGASAIFLAQQFGCQVVGVDYGSDSVSQARAAAAETGLAGQVRFEQGDAELLPFADDAFDVLFCECAFCTFPDKPAASAEFARVLRSGGRLGLSDLTRSGPLPPELDGLLAWITCIADAQPLDHYLGFLRRAGLVTQQIEPHDQALSQTVADIRARLLGAELLVKLKKIDLPGVDFEEARKVARSAAETIRQGKLGYTLLVAGQSSAAESSRFP